MAGSFYAVVAGKLSKDPESRHVAVQGEQKLVAKITIPTEWGWTEENKVTTWVTAEVWGKAAEPIITYMSKGFMVSVAGIAVLRTWTNKDGSAGSGIEIRDAKVSWHTTKAESEGIKRDEPATRPAQRPAAVEVEDLEDPFKDD